MVKRILAVFIVAIMLVSPTIAGPFEDGVAAYKHGGYAEAAKLYRLAAEQGNAEAQYVLGYMFANGKGVPQDYAEAAKLYRLAAGQGHPYAQFELGFLYGTGQGVPQDYGLAYMWSKLAAAQGHEFAVLNRDIAAGKMSPDQIAEAQRMARDWKPTN